MCASFYVTHKPLTASHFGRIAKVFWSIKAPASRFAPYLTHNRSWGGSKWQTLTGPLKKLFAPQVDTFYSLKQYSSGSRFAEGYGAPVTSRYLCVNHLLRCNLPSALRELFPNNAHFIIEFQWILEHRSEAAVKCTTVYFFGVNEKKSEKSVATCYPHKYLLWRWLLSWKEKNFFAQMQLVVIFFCLSLWTVCL